MIVSGVAQADRAEDAQDESNSSVNISFSAPEAPIRLGDGVAARLPFKSKTLARPALLCANSKAEEGKECLLAVVPDESINGVSLLGPTADSGPLASLPLSGPVLDAKIVPLDVSLQKFLLFTATASQINATWINAT